MQPYKFGSTSEISEYFNSSFDDKDTLYNYKLNNLKFYVTKYPELFSDFVREFIGQRND
jgi:hypothetical protein